VCVCVCVCVLVFTYDESDAFCFLRVIATVSFAFGAVASFDTDSILFRLLASEAKLSTSVKRCRDVRNKGYKTRVSPRLLTTGRQTMWTLSCRLVLQRNLPKVRVVVAQARVYTSCSIKRVASTANVFSGRHTSFYIVQQFVHVFVYVFVLLLLLENTNVTFSRDDVKTDDAQPSCDC
jgi:hypothetical protein